MGNPILTGPPPPTLTVSAELDAEFARLLRLPINSTDRDFLRLLQGSVRYSGGGSVRIQGTWLGNLAKGGSRVGATAALRILSVLGIALLGVEIYENEQIIPFDEVAAKLNELGGLHLDGDAWLEWASQFDGEEVRREHYKIKNHDRELVHLTITMANLSANRHHDSLKTRRKIRFYRMTRRKRS